MIVYVESNFVLELAFLRAEHESCEELLSLSESRGLRCFITRDKDFVENPDIKSDLATYDCRLFTKFTDGLGYIRNQLQL